MNGAARTRRPLASVYTGALPEEAWLVAETPLEVAELVREALDSCLPFVELTLATPDHDPAAPRWNGRSVYVDPSDVRAIAPPPDTRDDDP